MEMLEKSSRINHKNLKRMLILLLSLAFTVGCTAIIPEKRETLSTELKPVSFPQGFAFEDHDKNMQVRDENPIEDDFLVSLTDFSYKTATEIFKGSNENINFSPLSLYYALAVATTGAEGETLQELLSLMGASDKKSLSEEMGKLYRNLFLDNEIGQLKIANSLWMNKNVVWKEDFVENAAKNLYTSSYKMDFEDKKTEIAMSKWISDHTKGTLKPEIKLDHEAILSILNTVYFYDEWTNYFDEGKTKEDIFYLEDGSQTKTDYMNMTFASHIFFKGEGYTRSELNLKNSSGMMFIRPDEGLSPKDLLSSPQLMKEIFEEGEEGFGEVVWQVPKFSFSSKIDLKEPLQKLGVTTAFEENADFSSITDQIAFIGGVLQETHIAVDEKGVEASAYTQMNYCGSAQPQDKAEMILDLPFIYAIKANDGSLLFVGVCENPVAE